MAVMIKMAPYLNPIFLEGGKGAVAPFRLLRSHFTINMPIMNHVNKLNIIFTNKNMTNYFLLMDFICVMVKNHPRSGPGM